MELEIQYFPQTDTLYIDTSKAAIQILCAEVQPASSKSPRALVCDQDKR